MHHMRPLPIRMAIFDACVKGKTQIPNTWRECVPFLKMILVYGVLEFNPLVTEPENIWAGPYGKCVLYKNEIIVNWLTSIPWAYYCVLSQWECHSLVIGIEWVNHIYIYDCMKHGGTLL